MSHSALRIKLNLISFVGNGVFTFKAISKDEFICEYAGEVISEKEGYTRQDIYKKEKKGNFLYWCGKKW